ncbi:amidohydrolase family protein [Frigidibacter sp. MR17.14]|uniref:amidohydrolase family protein n=1 Tax=Frigidibacter sp. MR17.14 TaxID=3126509 RepID=UPI00301317C3
MILTRRSFLATGAAATLLPGLAAGQSTDASYLLTGATVLAMDGTPARAADVRLTGRTITDVGIALDPQGAEVIDLSGCLLIPGFVDTHWHMWNTIARGMGQTEFGGFAASMKPLSAAWTPEAAALSVRLALAEAWAAGITTVNNWAHNTKSVEFAQAELQAMREGGIRGRFSYGYPQALRPGERMDFAALESFAAAFGEDPLLHLGLCTRGPDRSDEAIWTEEWQRARALSLPITSHIASDRKGGALGNIRKMADGGYLGPDVQIVHATHATDADLKILAETGTPISISPWTEMEVGYGIPPVARMAASGVPMGLSVDNMVLAGNADMFAIMKVTADLAAGQTETQGIVKDAQVLDWATAGGAATLGLSDVGLIAPGMAADLVAVRIDRENTRPAGTPEFMLTHAAHPGNVDTVFCAGVLRKRAGQVVGMDVAGLAAEADEMIQGLIQRSR